MARQMVPQVKSRRIGHAMTTRPTFAHWLRSDARNRSECYLVAIGNHWAVVKGTKVVCSMQTMGNPTGKAKNRRALVSAVWRIYEATGDKAPVRRKRNDPWPTSR